MKKIQAYFAPILVIIAYCIVSAACEKDHPSYKEEDEPQTDTTIQVDTTSPIDTTVAENWFKTRGLILGWSDINKSSVIDYISIAQEYGLTTFSIFNYMDLSQFKKKCEDAGIDIEYEEHAMSSLLPQGLMLTHPEYFHMTSKGERKAGNGCPSCAGALETVRNNVAKTVKKRIPTNHKYYFWLDDGGDICRCEQCKNLNAADQALAFENEIIKALREIDPEAQLAHLAYQSTWKAPKTIIPEEGVFLEFAPFWRNYQKPLSDPKATGSTGITHAQYLKYLSDNLKLFPRETTQILEYWCDLSPYCSWSYDKLVQMPWNSEVFQDDLKTYASYGIRHIVSYAAYVGPQYVNMFGFPDFIREYAEGLRDFKIDENQ